MNILCRTPEALIEANPLMFFQVENTCEGKSQLIRQIAFYLSKDFVYYTTQELIS